MTNTQELIAQIPNTINAYIIEKEIGKGTLGGVYSAINQYTDEKVAIKILFKKTLQRNKSELSLINNEITILKILNHKNIIKLYEVFETSNFIFIVTELCTGKQLFDMIYTKKNLTESEALPIFHQLIDALVYLHNMNIVHRDIKPEHILFDTAGNIKLTDFGYSCYYNSKNNILNEDVGTPSYACPEMHKGMWYKPEQADVWSCGVVLYVMVCGYLPFSEEDEEENVRYIEKGDYEIPSYLSPQLVDLIKHMMDPDPKTRYYLADVINHAWFNSSPSFQTLLGGINYFEMKYPIDSRILNICGSYGFDKDKVRVALEQNKYNEYSTVYRLCVNKIVNAGMSSISDLSSNEFKGYIEDKNNILDEEEQHNKQEKFDKEIQEMKTILNNQEKQLINFEEEAMKALNEITTEYINIQKEEIEKEKKALAEESIIIPTNESNNSSASHKNLHKVVEPDYAVLPHIVISNARTIDRFESLYIERRDLSESPCGHNRDSFPDISIRGSGYPYGNYRIIDLKKKTKRGRSEMVVSTNIRRFRQYYNKEYDLKREEYLKRENPKRRKAITKRNEVEEAVRIYKKSIEVEEVKESDGESFSLNSFSSSFNGDLKKDDLFDFTEEEENKKEQEEEERQRQEMIEQEERLQMQKEKERQRYIIEQKRKYEEECRLKELEKEKEKTKLEEERKFRFSKRFQKGFTVFTKKILEQVISTNKEEDSDKNNSIEETNTNKEEITQIEPAIAKVEEDEEKKKKEEEERVIKERERIEQEEKLKRDAEIERARIENEEREKERIRIEREENLRKEKEMEAERLKVEEENERLRIEKEKILKETEEKEKLKREAEEMIQLQKEARERELIRQKEEEKERERIKAKELREAEEEKEKLRIELEKKERTRIEEEKLKEKLAAEENERMRQEKILQEKVKTEERDRREKNKREERGKVEPGKRKNRMMSKEKNRTRVTSRERTKKIIEENKKRVEERERLRQLKEERDKLQKAKEEKLKKKVLEERKKKESEFKEKLKQIEIEKEKIRKAKELKERMKKEKEERLKKESAIKEKQLKEIENQAKAELRQKYEQALKKEKENILLNLERRNTKSIINSEKPKKQLDSYKKDLHLEASFASYRYIPFQKKKSKNSQFNSITPRESANKTFISNTLFSPNNFTTIEQKTDNNTNFISYQTNLSNYKNGSAQCQSLTKSKTKLRNAFFNPRTQDGFSCNISSNDMNSRIEKKEVNSTLRSEYPTTRDFNDTDNKISQDEKNDYSLLNLNQSKRNRSMELENITINETIVENEKENKIKDVTAQIKTLKIKKEKSFDKSTFNFGRGTPKVKSFLSTYNNQKKKFYIRTSTYPTKENELPSFTSKGKMRKISTKSIKNSTERYKQRSNSSRTRNINTNNNSLSRTNIDSILNELNITCPKRKNKCILTKSHRLNSSEMYNTLNKTSFIQEFKTIDNNNSNKNLTNIKNYGLKKYSSTQMNKTINIELSSSRRRSPLHLESIRIKGGFDNMNTERVSPHRTRINFKKLTGQSNNEKPQKIVKAKEPEKYKGIVDIKCISPFGVKETVTRLVNNLKNNNIFYVQTSSFIFRCSKNKTSFDIEICELEKGICYYVLKVKTGGINANFNIISQIFN